MAEKKLPDKLSELILLALSDLTKARRRGFRENMNAWVRPASDAGPCEVCMAGAVMVGTLRRSALREQMPSQMGFASKRKLFAINDARFGYVNDALTELNVDPSFAHKRQRAINAAELAIFADYDRCKGRATYAAYRKAAKILAEVGL